MISTPDQQKSAQRRNFVDYVEHSVHTILNPTLEALHLPQQHDCDQRQTVRRQQEGGDQTGDAVAGATVDDVADGTECYQNRDEIQDDGGDFDQFGGKEDEHGQCGNYREKQDSEDDLYGLCPFLIS